MKKISAFQFVVLMFFARGFMSMTSASNTDLNSVSVMAATVLTSLAQAVLVICPLVLSIRYPDRDMIQLAFGKSRILGVILSVVYGVFFVLAGVYSLGMFSFFIKNNFLEFFDEIIVILSIGAAALYAACLGIEACARTAAAAGVLFVLMFVIVIFSVTGEYELYNLQIATIADNGGLSAFLKESGDRLGRSAELVVMIFLLPHVKSQKACGAFSYVAVVFAFRELVIFVVTVILGDYAHRLSDPFYALSTYAKTSLVERFDSIYMVVWTLAVFIKISLIFFFGGKCVRNIFPKIPETAAKSVTAAATVLTAGTLSLLNRWGSSLFKGSSYLVIVVLSGIIPLAFCFVKDRKKTASK